MTDNLRKIFRLMQDYQRSGIAAMNRHKGPKDAGAA